MADKKYALGKSRGSGVLVHMDADEIASTEGLLYRKGQKPARFLLTSFESRR
jgi:hypothetical protein